MPLVLGPVVPVVVPAVVLMMAAGCHHDLADAKTSI